MCSEKHRANFNQGFPPKPNMPIPAPWDGRRYMGGRIDMKPFWQGVSTCFGGGDVPCRSPYFVPVLHSARNRVVPPRAVPTAKSGGHKHKMSSEVSNLADLPNPQIDTDCFLGFRCHRNSRFIRGSREVPPRPRQRGSDFFYMLSDMFRHDRKVPAIRSFPYSVCRDKRGG